MRRNSYLSQFFVVGLAVALAGCGSGTSSSAPKPTGLSKRVLLTNSSTGTVTVVDAQKDVLTTKVLAATSPTKIITAGGTTIAMDSSTSEITVIDNPTEAVTFPSPIGDVPFDIAISPDGKTAWAAMRNFGFVQAVDTTTGVARPVIRIGNARRLVMSPKGTKLLVFPDPQAQVAPNTNTFYVVDTASSTFQAVTSTARLDQPFTAVFNGGETQAFILNCGAECGGTAASVVFVDFTNTPATFSAPVPVAAATVGLLSGSNLYVAGTPSPAPTGPSAGCPLTRCGALTVINATTFAAAAPVAITDGDHELMAAANNRIYVGATGCTVQPGVAANTVRGCLSIFDTTASTVRFPEESSFRQNFDVTGLQPISGRSIIYVVQGAELDIFDTNLDVLAPGVTQIDVVGKANDVVLIDP